MQPTGNSAREPLLDVDSLKFADVVRHWGRERLVHEVLVAQELARGIIRDGLRFQSVDPKWEKSTTVFRGEPLVGYSARQDLPPVMLRAKVLEHLFAVVDANVEPELGRFTQEFVTRTAFRQWLIHTGRPLPAFWYGGDERFNSNR
ncbi:MAG: hypothetical protein H6978_07940 [Gammaproteobacteria bacterium]|nr:hypothetical protein [Gammaproteobacteria bacterium]